MTGHRLAAVVALMASAAPAIAAEKTANKPEAAPIALPAPPPGKGQIVFFRPGGAGFEVGCSVNEKGAKDQFAGCRKIFHHGR